MVVRFPSRPGPYDIELNSEVYMVARDERGVPMWRVAATSEVAGEESTIVNETRSHRSWHGGFGYSEMLEPNTYHYVENVDTRFPGQLILGPLLATKITPASVDGSVTGWFEDDNYIYTLSGRYCNQLTPSSGAVTAGGGYPKDFGANYDPTPPVIFDNNVIVGFSTNSAHYIYKGALSSGTVSWSEKDDDIHAAYMCKVWWDTDYALVRSKYGSNEVSWIASGTDPYSDPDDVWSAAYSIGESKYPITGLAAVDSTVFVAKTDGLYYLDQSTQAPCLIPAMPIVSTNGLGTFADSSGGVWYPTKSGLYYFDPNTGVIENRTPGYGLPNRSGIKGTQPAILQYRGWIYCAVYDGTNSYIMVGKDYNGKFIWHGALVYVASVEITSLYLSSLTNPPRIWVGYSNGAFTYFKLPANGDNPLLDSNATFAASGNVYLPDDDYGVPGMRWNLMGTVIELENMVTNSSVVVSGREDIGSYSTLATVTSAGRTVTNTTGDKRFNRSGLKLAITNGQAGGTSTPIVRSLVGRAARRPTQQDVIYTTFWCSDDVLSHFGMASRKTGKEMMDALKTLDEYYPVTLIDYWSGEARSRTVLVMPVQERLVTWKDDKGRTQSSLAAEVVMRVVS